MQVRRQWNNIFNKLNKEVYKLKISYSEKIDVLSVHETIIKLDHFLGFKISLNKYKWIKII